MREQLARWLVAFTAVLAVLLALLFAWVQNRPGEPAAADPDPDRQALVSRGVAVYGAQSCASCHWVDGAGNPRGPLAGVGERLDTEAIHAWIIAAEPVADRLTAADRRAKQRYRELPEEDMRALVAYLQTL